MSEFKEHTLDQHTQSLADFLPGGCVFAAKNIAGTTHHKLLRGLASELQRTEHTIFEWLKQFDPKTTLDFIKRWEQVVGIPDGCFTGEESLETRRKHIIAKFRARGVATEQDFIDLAEFLGYDITIERYPIIDQLLPLDVPFDVITGAPQSRFLWVIVGDGLIPCALPYKVPFVPGCKTGESPLICFFNKLKPANTFIVYRRTPLPTTRITESGDVRVLEDGVTIRILEGN